MSSVYLLHLDRPFKHARHYIGFSYDNNPLPRITLHRTGRSRVTFMRAVLKMGITFTLTRVWYGASRRFERMLKDRKDSASFCPTCHGEQAYGNGVYYPHGQRVNGAGQQMRLPRAPVAVVPEHLRNYRDSSGKLPFDYAEPAK